MTAGVAVAATVPQGWTMDAVTGSRGLVTLDLRIGSRIVGSVHKAEHGLLVRWMAEAGEELESCGTHETVQQAVDAVIDRVERDPEYIGICECCDRWVFVGDDHQCGSACHDGDCFTVLFCAGCVDEGERESRRAWGL